MFENKMRYLARGKCFQKNYLDINMKMLGKENQISKYITIPSTVPSSISSSIFSPPQYNS